MRPTQLQSRKMRRVTGAAGRGGTRPACQSGFPAFMRGAVLLLVIALAASANEAGSEPDRLLAPIHRWVELAADSVFDLEYRSELYEAWGSKAGPDNEADSSPLIGRFRFASAGGRWRMDLGWRRADSVPEHGSPISIAYDGNRTQVFHVRTRGLQLFGGDRQDILQNALPVAANPLLLCVSWFFPDSIENPPWRSVSRMRSMAQWKDVAQRASIVTDRKASSQTDTIVIAPFDARIRPLRRSHARFTTGVRLTGN